MENCINPDAKAPKHESQPGRLGLPRHDEYYVYAMFCRDGNGPTYVKIGYTGDLYNRLSDLRMGCPIPAKMFAVIHAGEKKGSASRLEKHLHEQFTDKRTTGEWFRFDLNSQEDKKLFNDGSSQAIWDVLGSIDEWWHRISVPELDKHLAQERGACEDSEFCRRAAKTGWARGKAS